MLKIKIVSLLCVFSLIACKGKKQLPKQAVVVPLVDVIVATPQNIDNTIEANGTVIANEYVELHPEVNGRLTYLQVPEGKKITAGTIVARLNDADLQAQLAKSKVLLDLAQKTEERNRKLLTISGINQSDYDASLNQVQGIKADIAYTQALINKTIVKAPFTGIAGLRQVSMGAFVTTATPIVSIQQNDHVKIDFTVPEQYINAVKVGRTVEVQLNNENSTKQMAKIIAIEPQINTQTRNVKVRALLPQGQSSFGGFAKVIIDAGIDKKSILVPSNAIIPDDKNKQVVVVKGGKSVFVKIETGIRTASAVEVIKGINAGDSVVVAGVLFVKPNAKVAVKAVKQLQDLIN